LHPLESAAFARRTPMAAFTGQSATNTDLAAYMIPVNADITEAKVILVPEQDGEVNPLGVKGIGELGNVGTNSAIANAVYHSTGVRIRELPIRLEKLLATA
jgi:xanthine dehydrogenase YagR molybdenum-binding subunit